MITFERIEDHIHKSAHNAEDKSPSVLDEVNEHMKKFGNNF
ncbi:MAG: hypothetical protein WAN80_04930 [Nitrosotalea sp.]